MLPSRGEVISPLVYQEAIWIATAALIGLAILMMILAGVVIVHHLFSDRNRRLNRERFEKAANDLAPHLVASSGNLGTAVHQSIARNGKRATGLVLRKARQELRGPTAERISNVLLEIGVTAQLVSDLGSRREWKREQGARGLGECGGATSMSALETAAEDASPAVRRAVRESLLGLNTPRAIEVAIHSFLRDLPRRAGWRRSFYSRLSSVDPIELLRLVRSGSLDTNEIKLAMEALGDAGAQAATSIAAEMLSSEQGELRATAVRVLGKLDRVEFLDRLVELLDDEQWFVRAAVARSLEWILATGNPSRMDRSARSRAVGRLAAAMSDRAWWVRANASRALARAGRTPRLHLFESAEGTDPYAADAAMAALAMVSLDSDERLRLQDMAERRRAAAVGVQLAPQGAR